MANEPDLLISAGFSDAQLVKEANRIVEFYRRKGQEAEKAFQDAQGRVSNQQKIRAHQREMDRLQRTYDPAYRAARKYEKAVADLDKLLDAGRISQKQYADMVGHAAREMQRAGATTQDTARKMGTGWQNLGWQVGDFAVQVGAGTSAAQALGQQLPQLLGGFGAMGAMMGAGAAIAIPLGAALLKVAAGGETLEERMETLSKTTDAYVAAVENAATPLDELRQKYGDLADEIARVNEIQVLITGAAAGAALNKLTGRFATQFGGFGNGADQAYTGLTQFEATIERVQKQFSLTREEARKVVLAMQDMSKAGDAKGIYDTGKALSELLISIAGDADKANEKFGEFLRGDDKKVGLFAILEQVGEQISAADRAQRAAQQDLLNTYDANTQKLKKLADERRLAEQSLTEAVKEGKEDQAAAYSRVIKAIDKEVQEVLTSIAKMDGSFEASVKRMRELAGGLGGAISDAVQKWTGLSISEWGKAGTAANKGILDLIAQRESGGDYNAAWGGSKFTGGNLSLVNMTLNEILEVQKRMLAHPENTANSSALGRYQIVGTTLRGLIDELGLSGNELFSEEMQDRLAMQLVRRRLPQGVEGLRKEWVGLQNVPPALITQALNQQSVDREDPEIAKERQRLLDEEVKRREQIAKQARDYGDQLARNLLTEQQQAELARQQAEQIAAIKAQRLAPDEEARAIAAVNAEIEKQRVVYSLLEEAKRRQVDLDAMLTDGSMTYRQAIEALGEAKKADIIASNERAIAEGKAAEAQQLMADAQAQIKQGILDSIVAGESFADVLANVARMFAKAALEAALFNEGAWASPGGGSGLLGDLFGAIFKGWSDGGYTGPGGKHQPAGIVHRGEVVWSQADVRRAGGVAAVEAMRIAGGRLPGYDDGGPVGMRPVPHLSRVPDGLAAQRRSVVEAQFSPNISVSPGVTQADLAMTMQVARQEYERNFLPMLRKHLPEHNERFS